MQIAVARRGIPITIVALVLATGVMAWAQEPLPAPAPAAPAAPGPQPSLKVPYVVAPRTGVAPEIDGATTDRVWKRALHLGPFIDLNGRERAAQDTTVFVTYDETNLYIAFECQEPETEKMSVKARERDSLALLDDDVVEVYLDVKRDHKSYYHIIANAAGVAADQIGRLGPDSWNCAGLQVAANYSSGGWAAEMAIPFAAIGGPPGPATLWGVNFGRARAQDQKVSSYAGTRGALHDAARFAEMSFSGAPLMVDIWELGDLFGELRGGGRVRISMRCTEARKAIPAVRILSGFDSWVYTLPGDSRTVEVSALREARREIPYQVLTLQPAMAQIGVRDLDSGAVVFQSPLIPLKDTWLSPRIRQVRQSLEVYATAAAAAADDPAQRRLLEAIGKQRAALDQVEASIASSEWGSIARWNKLFETLNAIRQATDEIHLVACFLKGRSQEDIAAGRAPQYIVSRREPMELATNFTLPEFEDVGAGLYCETCPGEYEPVSFMVTASKDVSELTVTASDLISGTAAIPASNIDVRVVKCWMQAGRTIRKDIANKVFVPELLVKDDRPMLEGLRPQVRLTGAAVTDVPASRSKQFWVTIHVPQDAPHGLYEGKLTLQAQGLPPTEVKLACKVFGVELRSPRQKYLIYYRQTLSGTGREAVGEEAYRRDLADIREHGFDQAMIYDAPEDLGRALDIRTQLGLRGPVPVTVHRIDPTQLTAFAQTVSRLYSSDAYPEIHYYIVDEPRTRADIQKAQAMADAIRAGGGKTITALDKEVFDFLSTKLDAVNYYVGTPAFRDYVVALATGETQADERPEYYYWQCMQEDPVINRLFCGFYLAKSRLDGVFPYVYQHVQSDNPFDDTSAEGTLRHSMVTYPSAEGPITTIQWEGAREGRDDVRYLTTLQELIARGTEYPANPEVAAQVAAAEKLVDLIMKTIQSDSALSLQIIKPGWYQQMHRQLVRQAWWLQEAIRKAASPSALPSASTPRPVGEIGTPAGVVGAGLPPAAGGTRTP